MIHRTGPIRARSPAPATTAVPGDSPCEPADRLSHAHSSRYIDPARFSTSCDQLQRIGLAFRLLLAESMIAEVFASKSLAFTISTRVAPICRLVLSDTPSPLSSQN